MKEKQQNDWNTELAFILEGMAEENTSYL